MTDSMYEEIIKQLKLANKMKLLELKIMISENNKGAMREIGKIEEEMK